jgi:hypothetical protein
VVSWIWLLGLHLIDTVVLCLWLSVIASVGIIGLLVRGRSRLTIVSALILVVVWLLLLLLAVLWIVLDLMSVTARYSALMKENLRT